MASEVTWIRACVKARLKEWVVEGTSGLGRRVNVSLVLPDNLV